MDCESIIGTEVISNYLNCFKALDIVWSEIETFMISIGISLFLDWQQPTIASN